MTLEEFSNQFDVLVNSYTRFRDFDDKEPRDTIEFNEYEKSLYLTKAQEELVLGLYNGRNPLGESFEQTEELRRYLADLVVEDSLSPTATSNGKPLGVDSASKFFTLPENLWFITYEAVNVTGKDCNTGALEVYPVTQDEYHRIRKNPFRGANDRRALRLDLSEGIIEIVSKYTVTSYYLRYLKKLNPIILVNLPNGIAIGEKNTATACELNDGLHQKILELAVVMALQSKGIGITSQARKED